MSDGFTVMIDRLFGGYRQEESVAALAPAIGQVITSIAMDDEAHGGDGALALGMADGSTVWLYDAGRSCCESRYMQTDDDLSAFVGATLDRVEERAGPETEGEYGDMHETEFLVICTSAGDLTIVTHNEHNGYYGGFIISAAVERPR